MLICLIAGAAVLLHTACAAPPVRPSDPVPLWHYHSSAYNDTFTAASATAVAWAVARNYTLVRQEGYVFGCPNAGCECGAGLATLYSVVRAGGGGGVDEMLSVPPGDRSGDRSSYTVW